jgi:ABC-type long-subunit fatty acid transport system fused permease/ATPase subunit
MCREVDSFAVKRVFSALDSNYITLYTFHYIYFNAYDYNIRREYVSLGATCSLIPVT